MANITYNNIGSAANLLCFTDIPNILKVTSSSGGTKASYTLTFVGNLNGQTTMDGQWYITLFGDTVTNVLDASNAVNKNFYISETNTSTAASVARALRNCSNLAANFTVVHSGTSVVVTSREYGSIFQGQNYFTTNIDQAYMTRQGTDGSSAYGALNGMIDVDVYSSGSYITTLEKNVYNGETAFDMSPLLTTIAKVGHTVPFNFIISQIDEDGEYNLLEEGDVNYITVGYMCNQGYKYLSLDYSDVILAANVSRGSDKGYSNNMLLYTYMPQLNLSVYYQGNSLPAATLKYLDSAYNVISSTTPSMLVLNNDPLIDDVKIVLNNDLFNQSFYIEFTMGDIDLLYNVIKPLKATEYAQRIYWRNSYGGISFFDFTGQRSETRDVDISTYQKNIFDYYTDPMNELEKVYDNDVKYTVTLKSHLFEHDGKYIFNDIIQSSEVWTEINGQNYGIIIDSVSVDETDRNDIYEATVKYHYSAEPSLI